MPEAPGSEIDWAERGQLAWLITLGVLDPAPDRSLDAIARLAQDLCGAPVEILLAAETTPALVAGGRGAGGVGTEHVHVEIDGLVVGEVRGHDPARAVLPAIAAAVGGVLSARFERLRRDDQGRPVAGVLVDATGRLLWASPEFELLLGWPVVERIGTSALDILAPSHAGASTSIFFQVAASPGRSGNLTHRLTTAAGESIPFEIQSDNRIEDERVGAIALVIRPCPDPESEEAVLADQIWVLNRLSAGVGLSEVLARVVEMAERRDSRSHACVMRLSEDGMRLHPVIAPHVAPGVLAALADVAVGPASPAGGATVHYGLPRFASQLAGDASWDGMRELLESHGYRACWSLPVPSMEGAGQLGSLDVYRLESGIPSSEETRVLLLSARLTALAMEHEAQTRRLRFDATHDPLTGLANRVLFAEHLDAAAHAPVGMLFIDLDRFKLVNDTLGHAFGDDLLRAVAGRIAGEVAAPAMVARFGGDEFTILLPGAASLAVVVAAGECLLEAVSKPYVVRDQHVTIGASAGATFARALPPDAESLVRDADTALYHAKERGRGRVEAFDARLRSALANRVEIERLLRVALESGDLVAEFQPVVHIDSGRAVGVEALARCRTPDGWHLQPSRFIPVAEEVGLISQVFEAMLGAACRAARGWNSGPAAPLVVWVNLAPHQLGSSALVEQAVRVISESGADPATIGFEVTERGILPDPVEAARRLGELASLGVRLAVDDFGTGHSSLGYLQNLPVDTVKLDRSFVAGAVDDLRSRAIVRAVVDLATAIGLSCVAEGVETTGQLALVRELGCHLAQGFVYCKPRPLADVTRWIGEPRHPHRVRPTAPA